jgi:hypothetical protein
MILTTISVGELGRRSCELNAICRSGNEMSSLSGGGRLFLDNDDDEPGLFTDSELGLQGLLRVVFPVSFVRAMAQLSKVSWHLLCEIL